MKVINLEKHLPADLPEGEHILWHGRPRAVALARRAFRADLVAIWFGVMALWNALSAGYDHGWADAASQAGRTAAIGIASLALLYALGWLSAATTLYVLTSRRVVIKTGIALPVFFNIPLREIVSANVHVSPNDTGDLALTLGPDRRIAYLHLWPHARPFVFTSPQPMLRCVPHVSALSDMLREALVAASTEAGMPVVSKKLDPHVKIAEPRATRGLDEPVAA